ncbi:LysR family transcriptional regulator [Zobellella taiwanensis]|uniref:LysR family transcriptional regulator n=1 Tax=Zobellella taiwanensis TaxID=347535 RepID=A0A2P7R136_9GAMM|nr:LysR family transcriptional regulator [Zobellella taiwanensis]PSJ43937.1 LysR family transcriptional regulator [Zobellella taiwanensis]
MLLEGLETLHLLAQEKTMGKVAGRLYITQSAVSKRISNLEARLGKKLVEPDGRQLRLTAEAQALLERIGPSLDELRGQLFDSQQLTDSRPLAIACSETILAGYLGSLLKDYLRQDPYLRFSTHHTPVILERVRAGDAALGLCAGEVLQARGLDVVPLLEEQMVLVAPSPPDFSRPLDVVTIDLGNPANRYLEHRLRGSGLIPWMQMDSYFAAAELGRAGVAPAVVPLGVARLMGAGHDCRHAPPVPLSRPVSLVFRPSSRKRDRLARLMAALERHFAGLD